MEPTQRVPFGKTGLHVTRLGLGTAPLGGLFEAVADDTAHRTVQRAYDLGVRFFDTAPFYGFGLAERRLGHVLAQHPRDEFVLASKIGRLLRTDAPVDPDLVRESRSLFPEAPPVTPVFDFSYDATMRSLEESLQRLGLDRIDILHIHDPDHYYEQALSGAYVALEKLRGEGVIKAIGVGMNQAEMLARFARETDVDCFLVAGRYTLLDQIALHELLPLCVEKQIAVIIGGVYNSGILTNPRPGATFNYTPADQAWLERAQRIEAVCDRYNTPLMAAAIQFPLAHPAVACVLTGVRSEAEMTENERMFRLAIPADLWQDLRAQGLLPEAAPIPTE